MSLPSETTGYLHQEVLKNARYLVVTVDKYGLVARQDCPGISWRMEGLKTGRPLPDHLHGIIEATADVTAPQLFPYVQLTDTLFADVHVLNRGDEKQLILQDVSEGHGDEYKLQQKAHEVSLLLEQQAELNRQLEEKRREAELASRAKSRFIASMSHEFRSPISAIMGHAEMLDHESPGSDRAAAIQRASWHLLTLVENLLEQARMGEGALHLNRAPVDVRGVFSDMEGLFGLQARSRGLELEVDPGQGQAMALRSDELRLRQVLINLLSNAIRYTGSGTVRLSCGRVDDGIRFAVADTGPGISVEDRERIYAPFTQLQGAGEGAGLGLTIARQLVEALGGKLELDSEEGKGSTFHFSLPADEAGAVESASTLDGVSLLLVEDDDDLREMYSIFMEDWGIRVTAVPGYQAALQAFSADQPDLVMTDQCLQDGAGTDLLEELRRSHPGLGGILCSGSGSGIGQLDTAGADAFIVKPVAAGHLKATLLEVREGMAR